MTKHEIGRRFDLHQPSSPELHEHCDIVRAAIRGAALIVAQHTPSNREQSTAIAKLEEALFFAIGAIVRPDVHG